MIGIVTLGMRYGFLAYAAAPPCRPLAKARQAPLETLTLHSKLATMAMFDTLS